MAKKKAEDTKLTLTDEEREDWITKNKKNFD